MDSQSSCCTHPPPFLPSSPDPWSATLGHANIIFEPQPYRPAYVDSAAYAQLYADWHHVRQAYAQRLYDMAFEYGVTSRWFQTMEEKARTIDAMWYCHAVACFAQLPPSACQHLAPQASAPFCIEHIFHLLTTGKMPAPPTIVGPMDQAKLTCPDEEPRGSAEGRASNAVAAWYSRTRCHVHRWKTHLILLTSPLRDAVMNLMRRVDSRAS